MDKLACAERRATREEELAAIVEAGRIQEPPAAQVEAETTDIAREPAIPPDGKTKVGKPQTATAVPVALAGEKKPVIVNGRNKGKLSSARYKVIESLINAGPSGLTKDNLEVVSGRGGARHILKFMANSDPDWAAVILLPGKKGQHYRLRF